ncbi:MAG: methyltransferase domain-containing protein [Nitrososphaerota archaeon]|nr:methyltransferase domain-containing protein [Nitrososphaerota archaeon]
MIILEIGAADCSFSRSIGEILKTQNLFAVDVIMPNDTSGIRFLQLDLNENDLPLDDNKFDLIIAIEVLEHLYDPDRLFREVKRVLKDDGLFMLTTPNLSAFINRIALLFGYQPFGTNTSTQRNFGKIHGTEEEVCSRYGHNRVFTYKALREFADYYDFKIIEHLGVHEPAITGVLGGFDKLISKKASLAFDQFMVLQKDGRY